MTFKYSYKTSDGVRHESEIDAPGRDEAFSTLRKRGIRPIRLSEVDGPRKAAGHGRWWLWLAAVLLLMFLVALLAVLLYKEKSTPREDSAADMANGTADVASTSSGVPQPRRGIESQVVELPSGERIARPRARKPIPEFHPFSKAMGKLFAETFVHPAEAYLARFAQPGLEVPALSAGKVMEMLEDDLRDALDDPVIIRTDDPREVAELKRIVSGLKEEVALLLNSGKSLEEVKNWLEGRQRMEADYRKQIIRRNEDGMLSLEEANGLLVSMGFAPKGDSSHTQRTNAVQQTNLGIDE
jgi:hypothetical protein